MSYIYYNPNPINKDDIDCVVRALCKFLDMTWEEAYISICMEGYFKKKIPISNSVWSSFVESLGYRRYLIPDMCPDCYTVRDFCRDNSKGKYLLAVAVNYADQFESMDSGRISGNHVVCAIDGDYFDAWDSGREVPICYWS